MTTTDPLPAFLAVPDGEPEPVPEVALDWLGDRMGDEPEWSIEQALASAAVDADDSRLPDEGLAVLARWEIDGPGSAEWAMRKLAATEAEGDEVSAQADIWVAEIERWREARLRPLVARSAFFENRLTEWMRRLREADPKCKTRSLPSGDVMSRTVPPKVEISDPEAVAGWADAAKVYGDVVKTTVSIRVAELKKVAIVDETAGVVRDSDSGYAIPGTAVTPGGISYSVRLPKRG